MHLTQGAAHHREILAERGDRTPIHKARADDHAVRGQFLIGQTEVLGGVLGVGADFLKGVGLKQVQQPLARAQKALGVALLKLVVTATGQDLGATFLQNFKQFLGKHVSHLMAFGLIQ